MADDTRKVRVEEQLKIKIGEAKQLQPRNNGTGPNGGRDVYCTVALDQEEITRTPTIERDLSPFFGEEYQFQIPRPFRYLSIYVWDRDKHLKQDKPIGKIAIKREQLHIYNNKDHWFQLRPVDADSEVQGMIHLKVDIDGAPPSQRNRTSILKFNRNDTSLNSNYGSDIGGGSSNIGINDIQYDENVRLRNFGNDYKENTTGGTITTLTYPPPPLTPSTLPMIRSESLKGTSTCSTSSMLTTTGGGINYGIGASTFNPLGKTKSLLTHNEINVLNHHQQQQQQQHSSLHTYLYHPSTKKSPMFNERISPFRSDFKSRVNVNIIECGDLTKKSGNCDPYVMLTAYYSNKRKIVKRTKSKKKTVNPRYDEKFSFDLAIDYDHKLFISSGAGDGNNHQRNSDIFGPIDGADLYEICVTVWHDTGMSEHVFLGEVKLPMHGKQQQNALQTSSTTGSYYFLQPRTTQSLPSRSCATPPGTRLSSDNSLGSLRLKLMYTADHVFTLATYDSLLNLFLQSLDDQRSIITSAVYILGEIIANKTDVAQPLVRIFTYKQLISPIIKELADHEISKLTDPTTIFRGNTLVSKMMDEAMRLSGLHYLHTTLRPIVEEILQERKPCEIDPTRVKDKSVIETNLLNLEYYVTRVFDAITTSAVRCPIVLCQIFHDLKECAAKHFPSNKEVRYSVVSGFIFLRFFAPAILGPKLFDLTTEPLDNQTNRTLTLISKTIQSLGNLVSSRSAQQPCKEVYTSQLYKKFCTDRYIMAVKHFLDVISTVSVNPEENTTLGPVLLKEGMMTKRSQGRKIFGRHNFKQRYFRLTTQSLSYAKSKGKQILCDIPLSDILGVEKLNEKSFKMQNIFQIIKKDRTFYVQASNCVEEKEWIDLLSKICQSNAARLEYFHPCAYISGMWTCCKESDQNALGCQSVSTLPLQMELTTSLDPARDLQRLHTLIMNHLSKLEPSKYSSAAIHSYHGGGVYEEHHIDEIHNTLTAMIECTSSIEQIHCKYKSILTKETKYGSRQAPIGDDNYLHMARCGLGSVMAQSPHNSSTTTGTTGTIPTPTTQSTQSLSFQSSKLTNIVTADATVNRDSSSPRKILSTSLKMITPPSTPPPPATTTITTTTLATIHQLNEKSQHFFIKNEYLRSSLTDKLTQC